MSGHMNFKMLQDLALLLIYPLALSGVVYAVCLWRLLLGLDQKLEDLRAHCRLVHQHLDAHRVEYQSLWEALHHHEHGLRGRPGRVLRIIGRPAKDT